MLRKNSRTKKDIGTEIRASDFPICDMLEGGPPFRLWPHLCVEPVPDRLLADLAFGAHELGDAAGQFGLAPVGNGNSPPHGGHMRSFGSNVTLLHEYRLYKCACHSVNKPARVTTDKATCKVLYMPVPKRKADIAKPQKQKRAFPVGPDGLTANQRLKRLLEAQTHPTIRREADLWRVCNELLGLTEDDPDFVRQQSINRILKDQDSLGRSKLVAVIAEAMGVRAFWLQTGKGDRHHLGDELLREYANKMSQRQSRA